MTTLINNLTPSDSTTPADRPGDDTEIIGSRMGRIDPDNFRNQDSPKDGLLDSDDDEKTEDTELFDEPTDDDGDPTEMSVIQHSDHGENDHQQDDNYALGGHVTRSGSV
jgi:hypothetical protein